MTPPAAPDAAERRAASRWADALALQRDVVRAAAAVFLVSLGEQLWRRFIPKYLIALGAPVVAVGAHGSIQDLLDGVYQYPGGWIADRYGRRRALLVCLSAAAAGYALYAVAWDWRVALVAPVLVLAWSSMALPALFAIIGDALPRDRRTIGFTIESIVRRVPILIAPVLGGLLIARMGAVHGVRAGCLTTVLLALGACVAVRGIRLPAPGPHAPSRVAGVWRALPGPLKWLLASDILARACQGLVDVFLILYATDVVGVSAAQFGTLIAVQMATALAAYVPAAALAARVGRKPLVAATFLAFALFPLAVVRAGSFAELALAFVVGGLRELGEPARKSVIVDLAPAALRARSVGLYYLVRSLAVAPAAVVGGVLWRHDPSLPFYAAVGAGLAGVAVFVAMVETG